jgi:hypothetical protein
MTAFFDFLLYCSHLNPNVKFLNRTCTPCPFCLIKRLELSTHGESELSWTVNDS